MYVSCAGPTTGPSSKDGGFPNGGLVAIDIATQATTTLASGRDGMKQGVDCDGDGNVYWSDRFGTYIWNGSTSSASLGFVSWGLAVHGTDLFVAGTPPRQRQLDGTLIGTFGSGMGSFPQFRGIDANNNFVIYLDHANNSPKVFIYNRSAGTNSNFNIAWNPTDVFIVSNSEAYISGMGGDRFLYVNPSNPVDRSAHALSSFHGGSGSGLVFTPNKSRCFLTAGQINPDTTDSSQDDESTGASDIGILELEVVVTDLFWRTHHFVS